MRARQLVAGRHRGKALVSALGVVVTVSACSPSAQHGPPPATEQTRPTPQLAAHTAPGRSFHFQGMRFRLSGKIQYDTRLPQCPKPAPVVRIPAGVTAHVEVIPQYAANCPAQPRVRPVVPQYPAGYRGEVDLLSGYDSRSFYVRIAKPYAHPIRTLPAGSFTATVPASAATFEPGLTGPVFLVWDSATNAILLVTGPHVATLAQEIQSSLRPASA